MTEGALLDAASTILFNYLTQLDRLYGMYIDACGGFEAVGERISAATPKENPEQRIFMGQGDPNAKDAAYCHVTTLGHYIERNKRDGENQLLLSRSLVVLIYSIWDTTIRSQFCKILGKSQNDVKLDIMGDLRNYRHAIVHNEAILKDQTSRLDFIEVGSPISLNQSQMHQMFSIIYEDVSKLNEVHTTRKLNLPFFRKLNPQA